MIGYVWLIPSSGPQLYVGSMEGESLAAIADQVMAICKNLDSGDVACFSNEESVTRIKKSAVNGVAVSRAAPHQPGEMLAIQRKLYKKCIDQLSDGEEWKEQPEQE